MSLCKHMSQSETCKRNSSGDSYWSCIKGKKKKWEEIDTAIGRPEDNFFRRAESGGPRSRCNVVSSGGPISGRPASITDNRRPIVTARPLQRPTSFLRRRNVVVGQPCLSLAVEGDLTDADERHSPFRALCDTTVRDETAKARRVRRSTRRYWNPFC